MSRNSSMITANGVQIVIMMSIVIMTISARTWTIGITKSKLSKGSL